MAKNAKNARDLVSEGGTASISMGYDADAGAHYMLKPNGRRHYYFTTSITENKTAEGSVDTGDRAETSHLTGYGTIWVCDGSNWVYPTVTAPPPDQD